MLGAGRGSAAPQSPKPPKTPEPAAAPAPAKAGAKSGEGRLSVTLDNVLKKPLNGRVELHGAGGAPTVIPVSAGKGEGAVPAGEYRALVYAVEEGIHLLVTAKAVKVSPGQTATLAYSVLEGTAGPRLLRDFDRDMDLAIDRAEIEAGTNEADPSDIPGRARLEFPDPVKGKEKKWYRGELHAQSRHGRGKESVKELIQRAEQLGLDFLAIADPNTLAAAQDPEFRSDSVVLIPAMAWGDDQRGYALLYGPRTFPERATTHTQAQATIRLVQAQGGIVAAAHPCFPNLAWRWYVPYVNATEVWCRDWGRVPPLPLKALPEDLRARTKGGDLIYSIAAAVNTQGLSANGQAATFWDYELVAGRKVAAIAGSMTGAPSVPMGQPITYVFAEEKSVRGILDGVRKGHTYVSSSVDGPRLGFEADAMCDGRMDVGMGGAVPVGVKTDLYVSAFNAKGKKLEVLYNGRPIWWDEITDNSFSAKIPLNPETYSVYRARVVEPAGPNALYGPLNVVAMTSPIYAEGILALKPGMRAEDLRLSVQGQDAAKNPYVAPVYATPAPSSDEEHKYWRIEAAPQSRPVMPLGEEPLPDPARDKVFELKPKQF